MRDIRVTGVVTDEGKFEADSPKFFAACFSRFKGERVEVRVSKEKTKRSLDQNAYLQTAVRLIAAETGEDHDVTRFNLMREKWGTHYSEALGCDVPNKPSSASMTVDEASEFIEWIPYFAMDRLGIVVPLPNEGI